MGLAVWSPVVRAAEIADPAGGFSVQVALAGAQVCVVLPKGPTDAGCDGIDVDAMRKGIAAAKDPPFGFVVIRTDDQPFMVTLAKMDVRTVSTESIQATVQGSLEATKDMAPGVPVSVHGDAPADRYDLVELNGANVVRYAIDLNVPPEHSKYPMSRMQYYVVAARNVTYNVGFTGDRSHAKEVRELGDAVMKTLRVPPFKNEDFGQSRDFARGRLMGSVLGKLVGVGFVLALVILLVRQRNKKAPR